MATQPLVGCLVERAERVKKASESLVNVRPDIGDQTVWGVGFALVLGVGVATLVNIHRASRAVRRATGRGRWAVLKGTVLAIILLDALLTGFVIWLHTVAR